MRDARGRYQPPEGSTPRQRRQFYQDLRRQGRAQAGRCVYCGKLPDPGQKQCAYHLELARRRNAVAREKRRAKAEAARRALLPLSCSRCGGGDLVKRRCRKNGRQSYDCRACGRNSYGDGPPAPRPHYPCPYCGAQCWKAGMRKRVRGKVEQFVCSACRRTNTRLWPEDTPSPGGPFPYHMTLNLNVPAAEALEAYCQARKMTYPQAVREIFIQAAKAPASFIAVGQARSYGENKSASAKPAHIVASPGSPLPVIPPGGIRLPSALPDALAKLELHRQRGRLSPSVLVVLRVGLKLSDLALASLLEMMRRRGMNHQDTARALIAETAPRPERVWASRADDGGLDGW